MPQMNWLPWTSQETDGVWAARLMLNGVPDCAADEHTPRPKTGNDFFPYPAILADPIRATWPLMDATVFEQRYSREPTGPSVSPLWGAGQVIEYPAMPKLPR